MKRKIIIIGIIIVLNLGAFLYYTNNKKMSKEDFIGLMKSFENVSNVKLESSTTTKYIKEEYLLSIGKNGIFTWADSKTKECISWTPNYNTYSILEYIDNETVLENTKYTFIRI